MINVPLLYPGESEDIFRTLIEESPTPIGLYVGREMIIKVANKTMLDIWGKGTDVINKSYYAVLPELEGQTIFKLLDDVYTTGVAYQADEQLLYLHKNGKMEKFYFNFTFKPLTDGNGQVWGIINTAADVTELVLTREQLAESEERTQLALNAAELGTWNLDPNSNTIIGDTRCRELFGFKKGDEVKYDDVISCIHPADKEFLKSEVALAVSKDVRKNYDIKYRTLNSENGTVRWIRAKGKAYFNDDGTCTRFAGTVQDITGEIEANKEKSNLLKLIDNTSDFISLSDLDGNVSYVNAAGRKMVGLEEGAVIRHNTEYVMPGEIERVRNEVRASLNNTGRWSGEIIYRNFKTGEAIPVAGTSMLIYDETTGEPKGRASISRDLRREKADKKALVESEQLLKNITAAAPVGLWMSDTEGNITYVNQTWMNWTGYPFEENLGSNWSRVILPEDLEKAGNAFFSSLRERTFYEVDFRIRRGDGEIRWCVASGNPQFNSEGAFTGYIGTCADVTEKNIAEEQLRLKNEELNEQIKQFEFVTGFVPVQLWTANTNGQTDYVNKTALDFFGPEAEKLTGPEWPAFVHPDDREGCMAAWEHSLQTGDAYQFEYRLADKHGNYKWHLARALPFINDGKIVKWFGTNTDIEEQKQLQRQKDDFLGIASHELKTPVTSIKAYAQVLGAMLSKEGEQKKAEMATRLDAQVNRLTNLIGDLLDVTKINSGRLQFNPTWFNLNQVIKETVEDLQHTTQKHTLVQDFSETGEIFTDKDRISQVITNLITNAIKYSPHADQIIITTKRAQNEVIVGVQDFGIGIPVDKQDRVFEQFYRVSGNKQHTFPGLGLGLYISSEIIKREGGRIWVNSVEGKGSTFCFALPVIDNRHEQNAQNLN